MGAVKTVSSFGIVKVHSVKLLQQDILAEILGRYIFTTRN